MRNQHLTNISNTAHGGTEITTRQLFHYLEPEDLDGIQIITTRVNDEQLDPDKIRIYHLHDLALDPTASHLRLQSSRDRFDGLVFVSNWQYQQFRHELKLPYQSNYRVIENGVELFDVDSLNKPDPRTSPIRLIYTPTPHRGLQILVPIFEWLATQFDFIELDVYSSFKLYGWEDRDQAFQALFERCKNHPRIRYHGAVDQDTVRQAYREAHIFAYPSIWPETSCRCLIESMMAGCLCVHPNYAALPETAGGLTLMYDGDDNAQEHSKTFGAVLYSLIQNLRTTDLWDQLTPMRTMAHHLASSRFGWPSVIPKWQHLIRDLKGA